jgi:hypothetical protein
MEENRNAAGPERKPPPLSRATVMATIYATENKRRVIWTAGKTLAVMGIQWYPFRPPDKYRRMKKILKGLCDDGLIVARPKLQSYYTLKEVAYQRNG